MDGIDFDAKRRDLFSNTPSDSFLLVIQFNILNEFEGYDIDSIEAIIDIHHQEYPRRAAEIELTFADELAAHRGEPVDIDLTRFPVRPRDAAKERSFWDAFERNDSEALRRISASIDLDGYDIASIDALASIHRANEPYNADIIEDTFGDELAAYRAEQAAKQASAKEDLPFHEQGPLEEMLTIAGVGKMFFDLSQMEATDIEKIREICEEAGVLQGEDVFVNEELTQVLKNYACEKADAIDTPPQR